MTGGSAAVFGVLDDETAARNALPPCVPIRSSVTLPPHPR